MIYYIRYNVDHKNGKSPFVWKVFESESVYYLTNSVVINVPTWTSPTPYNDEFKYSLYCEGIMTECNQDQISISADSP